MRRALAVALVFALGLLVASVSPRRVEAGKPCAVPKDWGNLTAMTSGTGAPLLAFEDAAGVVRIVPANCGTPASPSYEVMRY